MLRLVGLLEPGDELRLRCERGSWLATVHLGPGRMIIGRGVSPVRALLNAADGVARARRGEEVCGRVDTVYVEG
jgi:hypothetical protein